MRPPAIRSFEHGIHAIDTGHVRPELAASHLIVRDGRAAFVDAGTNHSVPRLLAALEVLGVARDSVDHVILTHVHLDHAGGAGELMKALPGAIAVVHSRGAGHLADPAKMEAAARAVYGEQAYDTHFGRLIPIEAARIRAVADGETLRLGHSPLRFLETPGHALHHLAIHDEAAGAVFSGDAFGISYRVYDNAWDEPFIFATTSPTQFDPEQAHASVEKIRSLAPAVIYLGHYSRVTGTERLAADLHRDLDRYVAITEELAGGPDAEDRIDRAITDYLAGRLADHGTSLDPETVRRWMTLDVRLNAAGLLAWQGRVARDRNRKS